MKQLDEPIQQFHIIKISKTQSCGFFFKVYPALILPYYGAFSSNELQEASKALHDVLELDLPKMRKPKPADAPATPCHRCGRNLYG